MASSASSTNLARTGRDALTSSRHSLKPRPLWKRSDFFLALSSFITYDGQSVPRRNFDRLEHRLLALQFSGYE
jgi:hypothetical protein